MVYIYDIVLNFNDELLEFFEWEDNDDIKYIKRLPLIKVEDSLIKDVLENDILFDDLLLDQIKDKTIYYDSKNENYPVVVLSNQDIAIAVLINNNKEEVYKWLKDTLCVIDDKHLKLLEIVKLANK